MIMKLFFSFVFLTITSAQYQRRCRGITFNDRYFDLEVLKEGVSNIHQIVFNYNDNTLYFIYDQLARFPEKSLGFLNLETRQAGLIDGVRNASSVAIDQKRNVIYTGGDDGVFIINERKVPERIPIYESVRSVFVKDDLYFTNRRREAFIYAGGFLNKVPELQGIEVDSLLADDDNNIFFVQDNRLFRVKVGTRAVNSHEQYIVNFMTVNSFFKPYIGTRAGVYTYNKYKYALDKVSEVNNMKALTFNKNNEPIYGVLDVIVLTHYSSLPCFEPPNYL